MLLPTLLVLAFLTLGSALTDFPSLRIVARCTETLDAYSHELVYSDGTNLRCTALVVRQVKRKPISSQCYYEWERNMDQNSPYLWRKKVEPTNEIMYTGRQAKWVLKYQTWCLLNVLCGQKGRRISAGPRTVSTRKSCCCS